MLYLTALPAGEPVGMPRHDFAVFISRYYNSIGSTMTVTVPVLAFREPTGERDYVIGVIARAKPVAPRVVCFAR